MPMDLLSLLSLSHVTMLFVGGTKHLTWHRLAPGIATVSFALSPHETYTRRLFTVQLPWKEGEVSYQHQIFAAEFLSDVEAMHALMGASMEMDQESGPFLQEDICS